MIRRDRPRPLRPSAGQAALPCDEAAELRRAAIQVVAEAGFDGLTVEGLCARAGATPGEFHRHWSDPGEALREALDERMRLPQLPDLGTLSDDLVAYLQGHLDRSSEPAFVACVFYVVANARSDEELGHKLRTDFIRRRAANRVLIERAKARGELPGRADADEILDAVLRLGAAWLGAGLRPPPEAIRGAIQRLLASELAREPALAP